MVRLGLFLSIIGFGSLILPSFGFQFALMQLMSPAQPFAGAIVGAIGLGLLGAGIYTNLNQRPKADA